MYVGNLANRTLVGNLAKAANIPLGSLGAQTTRKKVSQWGLRLIRLDPIGVGELVFAAAVPIASCL